MPQNQKKGKCDGNTEKFRYGVEKKIIYPAADKQQYQKRDYKNIFIDY
jgi:hypothetical protein